MLYCYFVLPSDNMKPETAHSHSGCPCTSSYTPLDLHQSEEEEKTTAFSCNNNDIITLQQCDYIICSTVMVPEHTRGLWSPLTTHLDIPTPDLTFGRDKLPTKNIWQPGEFTDSVFNRTVGFVKSSEPV